MGAKLVKAIVAERKTILYEGKYVGPGMEVNLPADEVATLRDLGFLVNPEATEVIPTGEGPNFGPVTDGPTVTAGT